MLQHIFSSTGVCVGGILVVIPLVRYTSFPLQIGSYGGALCCRCGTAGSLFSWCEIPHLVCVVCVCVVCCVCVCVCVCVVATSEAQ